MKFGAVVGNPPYQEVISKTQGNKSLSKQLFPQFILLSAKLSDNYVSLITPSKWFTSEGQDGSFIPLRKWAKENNHFKNIVNIFNGKSVFSEAELGAVNYFLYDKNYSGNTAFSNIIGDKVNIVERPLFENDVDIILSMNEMVSILDKVVHREDFISLTTITCGRNAFGVVGKESEIDKISKSKYFRGAISLRCAHEQIKFIDKSNVKKNKELMTKWKIFTSKGNGGAGILGGEKAVSILGKSYIGEPNSVCTDSLIPIGSFNTKLEASNLQKYMATKFLRFMVGILKVSQNIYQNVYQFTPIQDFTDNSDIDWNKSISEIDKQLYEKYELNEVEINIIETMIKSME